MPSKEELRRLQSLSLDDKVTLTKLRITEWYEHYNGAVYVSFSGGKDSSVLLNIARQVYPDIPAVYCDTGLEFPEVKAHVKATPNVTIIKPTKTFKEVIDKYGWVYPSKNVAHVVHGAQNNKEWAINYMSGHRKDGTTSKLIHSFIRWRFLSKAPFKISEYCCDVMKKRPFKCYEKDTGNHAIIGTMTSEGRLRETSWMNFGCNAFSARHPMSRPMSFWSEDDILQYINDNNITIPTVYGDVVKECDHWKTTGEHRTGCMFCLIGVNHEKGENRFQRMHRTHPKIYDYCMDKLGMREILDYIGVSY